MKAAWYEKQGTPADVLVVGEMPTPEPGPGEVRIRVVASGINPGDVKKRQDIFGVGMPYPRVIPHSDGAGVIDAVGVGFPALGSASGPGASAWRPSSSSSRPIRRSRSRKAFRSSRGPAWESPGSPPIARSMWRGDVKGQVVLVQGGAGAVGQCAVALARHAGAVVVATVWSRDDVETAGLGDDAIVKLVRDHAPDGVDHVVEVAFHANIAIDEKLLEVGGSVATYATNDASAAIPFWPLVFKNIRLDFLGGDDFTVEAKRAAALALNATLEGG